MSRLRSLVPGELKGKQRQLYERIAGDTRRNAARKFKTTDENGAVQSSTYNTRPLIPEIMVRGSDYAVIRPRPSYDEMLGLDRIPDWLK